jgi:hypothetical protein
MLFPYITVSLAHNIYVTFLGIALNLRNCFLVFMKRNCISLLGIYHRAKLPVTDRMNAVSGDDEYAD